MKTLFQVMTGVTKNYDPTPEELNIIPQFIWCRYLSGDPRLLPYAIMFNNSEVPMRLQYKTIACLCSKFKIKYIPYPKNVGESDDKVVKMVQEHFKINSEKAKEYLELLSPEELKEIKKLRGNICT